MNTPEVRFTIAGQPYDLRIGDLTPRDAADFRRAVGIPLMQALTASDLDVIAGFAWLLRRRQPGQERVTYDEVAESFTYDDYEPGGAEPAEDVADPPR